MLKRINAILSWILISFMMGHICVMTVSLLTGWWDAGLSCLFGYGVVAVICVHAALSLIIVFFFHDGAFIGKYAGQNKRVIIQRITALAMIFLFYSHLSAYSFFADGNVPDMFTRLSSFLLEIAWFAAIFIHFSVSFSRSLISLGLLRSEKAEKRTDMIIRIISCVWMAVLAYTLSKVFLVV